MSGFNVGLITDHHLTNDNDALDMTTLSAIVYGVANFATGASRKAAALDRAIKFLVLYVDHDFYINCGDYLMSDSFHPSSTTYPTLAERNALLFFDVAKRAAHERNFCFELYMDGAVMMFDGNHETRNGYSQCGDHTPFTGTFTGYASYQAISTTIIKTFWPMPTDETYPYGGEDEGDPGNNDALSWLPDNSGWMLNYPGGRAQYIADHVTGPDCNYRGLNSSPLEIYWAFDWGGGAQKTTFIITHATYYTDPGDLIATSESSAGLRFRPLGNFTRGARQEAWIESVYAASDAPNKFEFAHHHTGGVHVGDAINLPSSSFYDTRGYGRNTGMTETGAEHARDHERAKRYGRNAKVTAHNHKFCHARKPGESVNEINLPTASAPSHSVNTGGTGWHYSEIEQNAGFGLAESEGRDLITLGDGSGTLLGNIKMLNCMGVATLNIGEDAFPRLRVYQTEISRGDDGASLNQTPTYYERTTGVIAQVVDGVATIDDIPREVVQIFRTADIDTDRTGSPFWTSPPESQLGDPVGQYAYEENRLSGAIDVASGASNSEVAIMAVPVLVYQAHLEPATLAEDGPGGFDAGALVAAAAFG